MRFEPRMSLRQMRLRCISSLFGVRSCASATPRLAVVAGVVVLELLVGAASAFARPAFAPAPGSPFATGAGPRAVAF